jgi:hypothetical protein
MGSLCGGRKEAEKEQQQTVKKVLSPILPQNEQGDNQCDQIGRIFAI